LASQARETDGDGAPIFTPEFPKADPYLFERNGTPAFALRDYGLASQSARDGFGLVGPTSSERRAVPLR
jgi:hypothetical protein